MFYSGYMDVVRILVEYGADINAKDQSGNTPLHAAAKYGEFLLFTHRNFDEKFMQMISFDNFIFRQLRNL